MLSVQIEHGRIHIIPLGEEADVRFLASQRHKVAAAIVRLLAQFDPANPA